MKTNLLLLLFAFLSMSIFGQTKLEMPYDTVKHTRAGKFTRTYFNGTTTYYSTNQTLFNFNKLVQAPLFKIGSDSVPTWPDVRSYISTHTNNYTLPIASGSVLGGVKVGTGLSIDGSGVLSASGTGTLTLNDTTGGSGNQKLATTYGLGLKQNQLNGTGFIKASATTISYDNSTYLTTTGDGSGLTNLTKLQVGLSNVDNTSDLNKPISTATQTALNAKIAFTDTTSKIATKHDIRDTVALTDYVYTKSQLNTSGGGGLVHFDNITNKYVVYKAIASGTAYSLTATDTVLLFSTTRPSDTLKTIGTYRLSARINLKYNGATFAANQTATFKIRRVNNTATDISGSSTTIMLGVVTTLTESIGTIVLPLGVYYSTNVITDILQLRGVLSAAPSAGSVDVTEAEIIAEKVN